MTESGTVSNHDHKLPPDGGYGWVVVAASFVVHLLVLGNIYAFGVLFPVYIDVFKSSQGAVAWVGSIAAGLMTGCGAYSGVYADEYGNGLMVFCGGLIVASGFFLASFSTELWHLYVTQGFIVGIGYSMAYISGLSVIGQWFLTKQGVAVGVAAAGAGLGQFLLALLIGHLIKMFKWRTTLRYIALIELVGLCFAGSVMRRFLPCHKRVATDTGLIYFKDQNFIYLYTGTLICTLGLFMPYTHIPKYAQLHGVSTSSSILILSMMGISGMVGRIVLGVTADRVGKIPTLFVCIVIAGISTLLWMICITFETIMIYAVVYGFFAGGVISLLPTVIAQLYGTKKLGRAIGVLYTSLAGGHLFSTPIGGFLHDATHNYYSSISVAGGLLLLSSLFILAMDSTKKFDYEAHVIGHHHTTFATATATAGGADSSAGGGEFELIAQDPLKEGDETELDVEVANEDEGISTRSVDVVVLEFS
jgi:MFS family permease